VLKIDIAEREFRKYFWIFENPCYFKQRWSWWKICIIPYVIWSLVL